MKHSKKKKPFRKRKLFRQLMVILVELELLSIICLCVGIYNVSFGHFSAREALKEYRAGLANLNIAYASAIPVLPVEPGNALYIENHRWKGPVLSKSKGTITGPSGKETYYNLNMSGVVRIMRRMGYSGEYWVRSDGVKMLGDYIMVAANLKLRPRGSLVETSLGTAMVCDTGGFAKRNPRQIDIAVTW